MAGFNGADPTLIVAFGQFWWGFNITGGQEQRRKVTTKNA
jgi:hypothetical protein